MVRIISALVLAVTAACSFAAEPLQLVDNPPDRHIVVKGDTLWDISGKFLKQPWRWPEIWHLNKEQIKNPDLIYPGDVVILDTSSGTPRLKLGKRVGGGQGGSGGPGKLEPKVYSTPVEGAISSIPSEAIEPFLTRPLIVDATTEKSAYKIVATQDNRILAGTSDSIYVNGIPDASVEKWYIYRKGKPLKDIETGKVIAHEAAFLGNARLLKPGEPALLRITLAKEEVTRGDYLIPAEEQRIVTYVPHRPEQAVSGRIINIYGGLREGGTNTIVTFNRGTQNGLEVGNVVALYSRRVANDFDSEGVRVATAIPDERYGLAFIFRTFDNVSYALVVDASKPISIGDAFQNP